MLLGVDAREIQEGVYTGIGRHLADFLVYFSKQSNSDQCIIFSSKKVPVLFGPKISNIVIPEKNTFLWDQCVLAKALKREKIDLFYSPYYKTPLLAHCPCVNAILDLMYLSLPEYIMKLSIWEKFYYAIFGRLYAAKAKKILTCSEYSKKDIIKIYNVSHKKIEVIPLSISHIYHPEKEESKILAMKKKYQIPGRYLLYMGNFKRHKNVRNIILAFELIAQKYPDLYLVLAGPKMHQFSRLRQLAKECGLFQRIIFIGKIIEDDEPHLLYCGAEAFVMPTLYEGFGLPPAEAMACGTPVIASNTTSIPEVVKDAGILVDPIDHQEIAAAISKLLINTTLRESLIQKGLLYANELKQDSINQKLYEFLSTISLKRTI